MSVILDAARVAAALNVVMLLAITAIWTRTYREVRAPLTLGVIVFGLFLLAENAVALYFYFNAPAMPSVAVEVMMVLQVLETVGIGALAYVTWQ